MQHENNGIKFFNQFSNQIIQSINKVRLGKVVEYDNKENKARIRLFEPDIFLIEVPVMTFSTSKFVIHSPLQEDDIVVVLFNDIDIENAIINGEHNKNSNHMNTLDNAIVIGTIHPFDYPLENIKNNEFSIRTRDNQTHIEIDKDDCINIKSNKVNISGNLFINGENIESMIRRIAEEVVGGGG